MINIVVRVFVVYIFLLVLFRISGKRSFSQMTAFDFVLLLIIGETTQQALTGNDFSITNAFLITVTLIALEIGFSLLKLKSPKVDQWMDGLPTVIIRNGTLLKDRMQKARVTEEDILFKARESQGIESMDEIKYAVLERTGGISIIPKKNN
jgi:uncharacterized membrane protein YcaP (DUF421 family)